MSMFSLRLADDDYEALQAVALLTGQPMAAIVRAAIGETVERFARRVEHDLVHPDELTRRRHALALLEERATTNVESGRMRAIHALGTV
jgi:predicted DNA-binding protein